MSFISRQDDSLVIKLCQIKIKIRIKNEKISNIIFEDKKYIDAKCVNLPIVKSTKDTLMALKNSNCSICRYGDGEFNLIFGADIAFQPYSIELADKLKTILLSKDDNILIAIPDRFGQYDKNIKKDAIKYWRKYMINNRHKIYPLLDLHKTYYDSFISRPYIDMITDAKNIFNEIKELWENKDIIIVEGKFSRLGYKNDLFSNTNSIERIICPEKNAYGIYSQILSECKKFPKDKLFIIALGPTATILAYDLAKTGYRALDLGHIDIEYEWFLKKATKKIAVKNKYVNEAKNGKIKSDLSDITYKKQICCNLTLKEEENA